jgi:hypothetical protein
LNSAACQWWLDVFLSLRHAASLRFNPGESSILRRFIIDDSVATKQPTTPVILDQVFT